MGETILYVVKEGDWLAKIADEHGTTVGAIWNHPLNAGIRATRSPDVIFEGDVFHIPAQVPSDPPSPPTPPPPNAPPIAPPRRPPWPYPPLPQTRSPLPTWECPGGTCECHPVGEDDGAVNHRIVFRDAFGRRMPFARCMIYERGRAITSEVAAADALGELEIELSAATTSLWLEWAPAALPASPTMPFAKRYQIVADDDHDQAAMQRRLANLGFSGRGGLDDCVRAYQVAVGLDPSGPMGDAAETIRQHHDMGSLDEFQTIPSELEGFEPEPELRALFDDTETLGGGASAPAGRHLRRTSGHRCRRRRHRRPG